MLVFLYSCPTPNPIPTDIESHFLKHNSDHTPKFKNFSDLPNPIHFNDTVSSNIVVETVTIHPQSILSLYKTFCLRKIPWVSYFPALRGPFSLCRVLFSNSSGKIYSILVLPEVVQKLHLSVCSRLRGYS